jgi:hypothetical protein
MVMCLVWTGIIRMIRDHLDQQKKTFQLVPATSMASQVGSRLANSQVERIVSAKLANEVNFLKNRIDVNQIILNMIRAKGI